MNIKALALVLAFVGGNAFGQSPDNRGEVAVDTPEFKGVKSNSPIPVELHVRNEGGSDGSGLCVISSILANGMYQGVPGLAVKSNTGEAGKGSLLWRTAKSSPGGYHPEKLARLVDATMPGEKYASYDGTDPEILEKLSRQGYPIGATMNTGALYNYAPIHHMISLTHYDRSDGYACVVDNNDPGKYHWMPTKEFDRRWIDGGVGWAWIWTRSPKSAGADTLVLAVVIVGICVVVAVVARDRISQDAGAEFDG